MRFELGRRCGSTAAAGVLFLLALACGGSGGDPSAPAAKPPVLARVVFTKDGEPVDPEPSLGQPSDDADGARSVERRMAVRLGPGEPLGLAVQGGTARLQGTDHIRFDARLRTAGAVGAAEAEEDPRGSEPVDAELVLRSGESELARFPVTGSWVTHDFALSGSALDLAQLQLQLEPAGTGAPAPRILLSAPWVARPSAQPATVILITSDTHRADHVSAINPSSPIATPHLDGVAREGALFTNCFSAANNTNPSHIALLTGVHPRDVRITNNRTRLHESAQTLAERFSAAGYRTYATLSAFHLFDGISGLGQGFDRMNAATGLARDAEETLIIAADWVDDAQGAPLFLWVHLFDVHSPYELPEAQLAELLEGRPDPLRPDVSLGVKDEFVPDWLKARGIRDPDFVRALYAGEVRYLDGHLGDFLALPRVAAATLAITADHGEGLGEQDIWWSHFGVLTPMVHVPLILRGPGVPAGVRSSAPTRQIDVGRTLLNLQGLGEVDFPGRDLTESLGENGVAEPRFAISGHGISASIEQGGWMLELFLRPGRVHSSGRDHPFGSCNLFELSRDPLCKRDVLLDEFERARRMRAALIAWLENAEVTGLNSVTYEVTPAQAAKLEELGYGGTYEALLHWWAPEAVDKAWDTNPWNLAFEGDGDPSLLR